MEKLLCGQISKINLNLCFYETTAVNQDIKVEEINNSKV